ncbi:MAG: type II CRISPR RNA-guided endonuclease Cas9 [Lachnospiraceae bacterium]|nr:type II CRISPR RNA-guided endonuclease Cas9 [Lachnospiraceae bacterium]
MKEYYLGLDMGTSSVGWAVTDTHYNLLRAKGKDMWGVRLFSEADTSAGRRGFRTARRRRQREKARIGYLKEIFADEINKIDPGFFQRLEESFLMQGDKTVKQPYALFADSGYTDKDYYEQYPTIFHLRKELIENKNAPYDVRLIYLALLNMFKHRGHFLNSNIDSDGLGDVTDLCNSFVEELKGYANIELNGDDFVGAIEEILADSKYGNKSKAEAITEKLGEKNKTVKEMIKVICGLKAKIPVMFEYEQYDEDSLKLSFSFRDSDYDEKIMLVEKTVSEEALELLYVLKAIHDWGVLVNIMKSGDKTYSYLSQARVESYNKHAEDLALLKKYYKENIPEKYDEMFRIMGEANYSAYVGSVQSKKEETRRGGSKKRVDLYATIKKDLKDLPDTEEKQLILDEIEKETFLPKQLTASNGVIPNQIHLSELKVILKNAEEYLDFLKNVDDSGINNSEKIIELFKFQIPYYIGPLVKDERGNGWVIRKEEGKVYPWNFSKKIDEKKTAEKFINQLVNHCTYLTGEQVLPKNSLLYERFMVLNELNNLTINGEEISVELKQSIYNDLFKKGKKVTQKTLIKYLKENAIIEKNSEPLVKGIDGDFTNTLSNYKKFCEILAVDDLSDSQKQMVEDIIRLSTIYGDSKKFLTDTLVEKYKDNLSNKQLDRIIGIKFKDWGKLSKELLMLEGADVETGEVQTIMHRMWNDNKNLMELLSKKYTYRDVINEKSMLIEKTLNEIEFEDLEELYISAPVKRMTWQTIKILKEICNVMGCEPKKIFVEMARENETVKERKDSRKLKFLELYKKCKDEKTDWLEQIKNTDESTFRSKKLYLYYTQKGKCMYSGRNIELSDLFNDNLYDIDHIYPRHFVKDDSIENNLVLVYKPYNAHKSDAFPIEASIRSERYAFWKMLKDGNFITAEKFNRLTRNTDFTDDERAAFISRQLVETRQGTKVIAQLFEKSFENTKIIYSKAGNVSQFRQKYGIIKCREINDLHHAKDAYLNIVVGNTYNVKFTSNPINFIKEWHSDKKKNNYNLYRVFDYNVRRGDEIAWIADNNESIEIVKKVMRKNTPLVTRRSYEEHGGIADQTIYTAKEAAKAKGVGYIPVKESNIKVTDTTKYGGFKKVKGAYFVLIEHTEKGRRIRTLEAMPIYMKAKLKTNAQIEEYFKEKMGYVEPVVRMARINMYSLIKVDGYYLYLTGRGDERVLVSNAIQMKLSYDSEMYIKLLAKVNKEENEKSRLLELSKKSNEKLYDELVNKHNNNIFALMPNSVGKLLVEGREKFGKLEIEKQVYVLLQILKLSSGSNNGADLCEIGGSKKTGYMRLNKKISDKLEFKIINQSVTGLFANEIDLLTV